MLCAMCPTQERKRALLYRHRTCVGRSGWICPVHSAICSIDVGCSHTLLRVCNPGDGLVWSGLAFLCLEYRQTRPTL